MHLYTTPKGRWAGTRADAKLLAKVDGGWQEREVPTDKPGLLAFLNEHEVGGRPYTLTQAAPVAPRIDDTPPVGTRVSLALDDAWDGLSLARKLHFASLAMEEARSTIGAENAPKKAAQGYRGSNGAAEQTPA